jgi:hypothetical protein
MSLDVHPLNRSRIVRRTLIWALAAWSFWSATFVLLRIFQTPETTMAVNLHHATIITVMVAAPGAVIWRYLGLRHNDEKEGRQ